MQQQSNRAVKTFTIGFDEADFDESSHARTGHCKFRNEEESVNELPIMPVRNLSSSTGNGIESKS